MPEPWQGYARKQGGVAVKWPESGHEDGTKTTLTSQEEEISKTAGQGGMGNAQYRHTTSHSGTFVANPLIQEPKIILLFIAGAVDYLI